MLKIVIFWQSETWGLIGKNRTNKIFLFFSPFLYKRHDTPTFIFYLISHCYLNSFIRFIPQFWFYSLGYDGHYIYTITLYFSTHAYTWIYNHPLIEIVHAGSVPKYYIHYIFEYLIDHTIYYYYSCRQICLYTYIIIIIILISFYSTIITLIIVVSSSNFVYTYLIWISTGFPIFFKFFYTDFFSLRSQEWRDSTIKDGSGYN